MTPFAEETRWIDATGQAEMVHSGTVHPRELVVAAIERIEALNPGLNAVWAQRRPAEIAGATIGGMTS